MSSNAKADLAAVPDSETMVKHDSSEASLIIKNLLAALEDGIKANKTVKRTASKIIEAADKIKNT